MRPLEERYRSMRPRPNLGRPSGGVLLLTESQLDGPDAVRRLRESGLDGGFKYRQRMCLGTKLSATMIGRVRKLTSVLNT